ncbi:MAG: cation:proton antiporter [Candidatus Bathyarchaeia archaeon]|nr:cation:proton antiporter [Candidatus Bathyarchaeota archaeon]
MDFLIDMVVILIASFLSIILMNRFKLSTVIGLLLTGMIVGPYGLNLVKNSLIVNVLAELGVILLLFLLGLELNPKELTVLWSKTLIFALCEIIFSFSLGLILGLSLGWKLIESFILGSILSISSTAIIGKTIMDEYKIAESKLIINILIIEDLFVVFLLFLMPGLVLKEIEAIQFLFMILKAAILITLIFIINKFLMPRIIDQICHYEIEIEEAGFLLALILCLTNAYFSKFLGFSPGLGAFLSGLFLVGKRAYFIREKLRTIKDLFIVIFFISMGMLIDLSFLKLGGIIILIVLISIIGKILGFIVAGYITNFLRNKSYKMGLTMIPRGEFSFVIARTSINLGIVSPTIFPIAGAIVLVTSIIESLIKRLK